MVSDQCSLLKTIMSRNYSVTLRNPQFLHKVERMLVMSRETEKVFKELYSSTKMTAELTQPDLM